MHLSPHIGPRLLDTSSARLPKLARNINRGFHVKAPESVIPSRRSPSIGSSSKDLRPISLNQQKRIAIIGANVEEDELDPVSGTLSSSVDDDAGPRQLTTTESAGALPPPGKSTATSGAGTGLAEALNLAGGRNSSSASNAAGDLPTDEATDPELASWVEQLQQESQALATQLSQYRSTAAAKISSLAGRATLDQDARQELEELTAVLQAALAQVDVLSRQAALAEVLQHRIADQEDVLQQLQTELEHVDAQRAAEYETTLANITELEEALALAQEQVDASHRLEEMLELKEALQKQLDEAKDKLSGAERQLADSRKESEALAARLKTAEEAKSEAEKAKQAAEAARTEAEQSLSTLKSDYENLEAEVKKAQEAAEQLAAAAAGSSAPQQQQQLSKKAKRKLKRAKGFGKIEEVEESGDESDGEGTTMPDLSNMVSLMKQKDADVAAGKAKLEEATKKLTEAEQKLKASEAEVTKLKAQLETQKKDLEAQAAKKLEEAEATFSKQLAEMQTLLSDYQTQVIDLSKQNNQLEEEALALEQKLGEAEGKVEKGEKRLAELSSKLASGADGSKELRQKIQDKEDELKEAKEELQEIKDELKSAVKREAAKALELSRAQQDLLLAEKANTKLQTERDDLAKKVVSLRSSQLKAEQAIAESAAAEAKLAEAAQQLASVSTQLSTETARAKKLAGEIGDAKEAEKTALAKLAAAQTALEDQQRLASQRGGQVQHLSSQVDSLKATMANMTKDKEALQALTAQISERDDKIQTAESRLQAAKSENTQLASQLEKLKQQLKAASTAAPPAGVSPEELKKAQTRAAQLADQTAQLQAQLLKKDADIASLADKLEAAVAAAAEAAEQSQTTAAAAALARGAAGLNEETKRALAVAQQQVDDAVRARLSVEKEVNLLRASNDNYAQQVETLTTQAMQLEANITEATQQSNLASQQLQQVKQLALQETEAAAAILGKAERLIKSLAEQRAQQQQRERQAAAAAAAAGNQQEVALRAQMADLQVKLAEQADLAADATARAEQLEEDLVGLRAEVAQMRRTATISGTSPLSQQLTQEVADRERALAEKLAAAEARSAAAAAEREAIKQRVLQLETELRQKDKVVEDALQAAAAGGGKDKQVATLMARVSSLEAQNSQLRVAAAKREQVLQQSRKFIESHLARWAPNAAGAAAATAAAPTANGAIGRDGPNNGVNPN